MINEKESDVLHAHDLMFKSAMTDLRIAKDVLSHHLPERIKQKIRLDTLRLENGCQLAWNFDPLLAFKIDPSLLGKNG